MLDATLALEVVKGGLRRAVLADDWKLLSFTIVLLADPRDALPALLHPWLRFLFVTGLYRVFLLFVLIFRILLDLLFFLQIFLIILPLLIIQF